MKVQPSRILNENSTMFGLSVIDLAVLGYALIILHSALAYVNLELAAFPVVGFFGVALVRIRISERDKIIRDWLSFHLLSQIISKKA